MTMIKNNLNNPAFDSMPQVTFALFAYNQEEFICEAISSAFSQDYQPLTIIISDDCSNDNTFELIKLMVASYLGPHKIIINRNVTNMGGHGVCAHVNKVFELVEDDLIILAAGDDISLSKRTSVLVKAWLAAGKPSGSLHSAVQTISNTQSKNNLVINGRTSFDNLSIQQAIRIGMVGLHGCSHAVTRDIFTQFGRLPDSISFEDRILAFRSFLVGKIIYCDEVLLQYRLHDNNLSGTNIFSDNEKWQKWINNMIGVYISFLADYKIIYENSLASKPIISEVENLIMHAEGSRLLITGNFFERFQSAVNYTNHLNFSDQLALMFKIFDFEDSFLFKIMSFVLRCFRKIRG